jgi:hypothetical protein
MTEIKILAATSYSENAQIVNDKPAIHEIMKSGREFAKRTEAWSVNLNIVNEGH